LAGSSRGLALCLKSGIPAVQALSVVARVTDNDYIGQRIEQMRDGVESRRKHPANRRPQPACSRPS